MNKKIPDYYINKGIVSISFIMIFTLLQMSFLAAQERKDSFEEFINENINTAISKEILEPDPVIIIEGHALNDTLKKVLFFNLLNKSDIKEVKALEAKVASEIFDGQARNGALLVICNRQGKKKIKQITKSK